MNTGAQKHARWHQIIVTVGMLWLRGQDVLFNGGATT